MAEICVSLTGLVSSPHLNGQQATVTGCTMNSRGDVRFNVKGPDFNVSVRPQNMEWSSIRDEDAIVGLMLRDGNPIITLSTNPSGSFMTDIGKIVLSSCSSIHGMRGQELRQLLINCCHALHMSPVPVQEPGWSEVQRNLQLMCAEIMRAFGLDRLAAQYAKMVLATEPTNVRAREFMPK
jgi:hypothetical protein